MAASTSSEDSQIVNEKDCFYFESDHLALKGNKDYSEVLKTLFVLQAQKCRLLKDYEEIVKLKNKALEDPLSFVEKLKKDEGLNIPEQFHIAEVPKINWSKFNMPIPENLLLQINNETTEETITKNDMVIKKPRSVNRKIWTMEEQKRLEELLIEYPPEDVEFNRFRKIANALGNVTVLQVSSRVQKYFIKLYKMGLPIPGRIPKSTGKKKSHKHQRYNHFLMKPSTFFPEFNVPVMMEDSDECPGPSQNKTDCFDSKNYLLTNSYHENSNNNKSDNELQLNLLKRVKAEKLRGEDSTFQHLGYRCDYCNEEPIIGCRWQCANCVKSSIDFCTDCVIAQMYSENSHPLNHKLIAIRNNEILSSGSMSDSSEDSDSSQSENSSTTDYYKNRIIKSEECDIKEEENDYDDHDENC